MTFEKGTGPRKRIAILLACLCAAAIAGVESPGAQGTYQNPVISSDAPDPSVIRVGNEFWATTTTSEWGPPFLIWRSDDLVNWEVAGSAFAQRPPWSESSYWASEFHHRNGKFYLYYTARKKDGPLCVAVATALHGAGPYTDAGPIVCQEMGSIDAFPVMDENGQLYLLWKEDGNSRDLPTPIWAQPLSEDGTRPTGERRELIRNDVGWEAQLVEGPYVIRRDGWFYLFYSGNACCGRECNYAMGVARARKLLGPWEKNRANPILKGNSTWRCPGHGTVVTLKDGRDYLMYHAYGANDGVYVGRQALIDRVEWRDGWPMINGGRGPSASAPTPFAPQKASQGTLVDDFSGPDLLPGAQWPHGREPQYSLGGGKLHLRSADDEEYASAIVAWSTRSPTYDATAVVEGGGAPEVAAGLAAYGDPENAIGIALRGREVQVWHREKGRTQKVASAAVSGGSLYLRLQVQNGHRLRFSYGSDGSQFKPLGSELDGRYLPPWDRGVRVALTVGGKGGALAVFDRLWIEARRKEKDKPAAGTTSTRDFTVNRELRAGR